jgi:hypothetical protein
VEHIAEQYVDAPHRGVHIETSSADLIDELIDGARTTRNTIIITLNVGAYDGAIPLISCTSRVEQARNGMEQITYNMRFTIPAKLSMRGHKDLADWRLMYSRINEIVDGQGNSRIALFNRALIELLCAEIARAAEQIGAGTSRT